VCTGTTGARRSDEETSTRIRPDAITHTLVAGLKEIVNKRYEDLAAIAAAQASAQGPSHEGTV
jgi:hypothetical protein